MTGIRCGSRQAYLDLTGTIISFGCLVHCLALPLFLTALPAIFAPFDHAEWVHPALVCLALPVALVAFWRGFKLHRKALPGFIMGFGASALVGSLFPIHPHEVADSIGALGAGFMAIGHILNHRHRRLSNG